MELLIAEDEQVFLNYLQSLIPEGMFETILLATNGKEALDQYQSAHPEVILMDVQMPCMSGLEVVRAISDQQKKQKGERRSPKIIIISSFAEFKYAQEALNCGAISYLLKTSLSLQSIKQELQKAVFLYQQEQEMFVIKKQYHTFERDQAYLRVLQGTQPDKQSEQLAGTSGKRYLLLILQFYFVQENEIFTYAQEYLKSKLADCATFYGVEAIISVYDPSEFNIILSCSASVTQYQNRKELERLFELLSGIPRLDKVKLIGCTDGKGTTFSELYAARIRLLQFKEYSLFLKKEGRIFVNQYQKNYLEETDYTQNSPYIRQAQKLMIPIQSSVLQKASQTDAQQALQAFFDFLEESQNPVFAKHMVLELFNETKGMLRQAHLEFHFTLLYDDLNQLLFLSDYQKYFTNIYNRIIERLNYQRNSYSVLVIQCIQYIHQHYYESLTLSETACSLAVSESYLSNIFKKQTGIHFVDYVNQLRVEHAQELLRTSSLRIQEIAEKVGFQNAKYFSSVYKKITGKTPYEDRTV